MISFDGFVNLPLGRRGKTSGTQRVPDGEFALRVVSPDGKMVRRLPCHTFEDLKQSCVDWSVYGPSLPDPLRAASARVLSEKLSHVGVLTDGALAEWASRASADEVVAWDRAWDMQWKSEADRARAKSSSAPSSGPVIAQIHVPSNPLLSDASFTVEARSRQELDDITDWFSANRRKMSSYQAVVLSNGLLDAYREIGVDPDASWGRMHLEEVFKASCGPVREGELSHLLASRDAAARLLKMSGACDRDDPVGATAVAYLRLLEETHERDAKGEWTTFDAIHTAHKMSQVEQALGIEEDLATGAFEVFFYPGSVEHFKTSQAPSEASPVIWTEGPKILTERMVKEMRAMSLEPLEDRLTEAVVEGLRLRPVETMASLEADLRNLAGRYLYDACYPGARSWS